jgi:chromosome segregation ATPase
MARFKLINGTRVEFTAEEEALRDAEELEWQNSEFDRSMEELRTKRNNLLAETDYLALSDQTMSAEMTTYRQALRDITNGLTTVADVEAVVFPEKPEV